MLGFLFFLGICFFIVVSYLIGSIPSGYLLAKAAHVNIMNTGSKSIGATNVTRVTNGKLGILTLVFDFIKGYFAVVFSVLIFHLLVQYNPTYFSHLFSIAYISCFFVVLGHCFSIYIKFKGGKGISTGAGVLLAVSPIIFLVAAVVIAVVFISFKIVSLGSLIAAGASGITCYIPWFNYYYLQLINASYPYFSNIYALSTITYFNVLGTSIILMCMVILIIIKHKQNIKRLIDKKERIFQVGKDDKNQQDFAKVKKHEYVKASNKI